MTPRRTPVRSCIRAVLLAHLLGATAGALAEEPVPIEEEPRHRLVFRNAHVRFFDVRLPPGYRSAMHVHHHDGVFVNIAPSETEAEDWGKPPVRRPGRTPGETYFIGYSARPKAHRVSNVGDAVYHVTDTEILQGCGGAALPDEARSGTPVMENARVRVSRIELAPGAAATLYGPCGMLVAVTGGTVRMDAPGHTAVTTFAPAGFHWRAGMEPVTLANTGPERVHLIDIVVK